MSEIGRRSVDATLDRLAGDLGDVEVVRPIVEAYLSELPDRVATIVGSHEQDFCARAAHSLKSTSRAIGALDLADLCQRIELDPSDDVARAQVASGAERAIGELRAWLDG